MIWTGEVERVLFEVLTFELNPEYQEHSHIKIWGKRIPGREDSKCKFSKARITDFEEERVWHEL